MPALVTPAGRALLSSAPGWVLSGFSGGLDLDFANGRYYGASLSQLACSRASSAYGDDAAGNWSLFSANTPVITNKGLQVFESSTNKFKNNSMQGAAAGSPGTIPTGWTSFASPVGGLSRQIVGTGTENGIDYLDFRYSGTATLTTLIGIFPCAQNEIAAAQGDTWTTSLFMTLRVGSLGDLVVRVTVRENDSGGVLLAQPGTIIVPAAGPLGLARYSETRTLTNASTAYVSGGLLLSITNGSTYDFTFRLGWPQLEKVLFATSPIRTANATVTRNSDVVTVPVADFGVAATLYGTGTPLAPMSYGNNQTLLTIDDGSNTNRVLIIRVASSGNAGVAVSAGPVPTLATAWAQNAAGKIAFADQSGDGALSFNGGAPATASTSGYPSGLVNLHLGSSGAGIGQWNGYIARLAAARARLPNATIQRITA